DAHLGVVPEAAFAAEAVDGVGGALGQRFLEAGGDIAGRQVASRLRRIRRVRRLFDPVQQILELTGPDSGGRQREGDQGKTAKTVAYRDAHDAFLMAAGWVV